MRVLLLGFKAVAQMGCFWWAGMPPAPIVAGVEAEPMKGCCDGPIGSMLPFPALGRLAVGKKSHRRMSAESTLLGSGVWNDLMSDEFGHGPLWCFRFQVG